MARLMQTTNAKERVYQQSISFFSTNETVFTALSASFTGLFGLHESTETLNAMKEGHDQEPRNPLRDRRQGAARKRSRPATARPSAPTRSRSWSTAWSTSRRRSRTIINEMRELSTKNSAEIRDAVEDGKRRLAQLAAEGNALLLETRSEGLDGRTR